MRHRWQPRNLSTGVVSIFVAFWLWWILVATHTAAISKTFGDRGCINFLAVDGQSWIATMPIPEQWEGPVSGEFTWRFSSGSFDVDGTVITYRQTDNAGPCIGRSISN